MIARFACPFALDRVALSLGAVLLLAACADEPGAEGGPGEAETRKDPAKGAAQQPPGEDKPLSDAEMHPLHPLEHHFRLELPRSTSTAGVDKLFERSGGAPSNVARVGDPGPIVDQDKPAGEGKGEGHGGAEGKGTPGTGSGDEAPEKGSGRNEALGVVPGQPAPTQQRGPGADEATEAKPAPTEPERFTFSKPTVLIGRAKLFVGGEAVADVRCHAGPEPCEDGAREGPTNKFELDFAADALDGSGAEASVKALAAKLGKVSGEVRVLADRRISYTAVRQVLATVTAAGGAPVVVVSSYGSEPVLLWPEGTAHAFKAPPNPPAPAEAAADGDAPAPAQPAGSTLPATLKGVQVHVGRGGVSLALTDADGAITRPPLFGNVLETLAAWALRIRRGFPDVKDAKVEVVANAPFEEVSRVLDGLRDSCAAQPKGTPCHEPKRYFERVSIEVLGAEPGNHKGTASPDAADGAGAPAGATPGLKLRLRAEDKGDGKLRLGDDKAGSRLRLAPSEGTP